MILICVPRHASFDIDWIVVNNSYAIKTIYYQWSRTFVNFILTTLEINAIHDLKIWRFF